MQKTKLKKLLPAAALLLAVGLVAAGIFFLGDRRYLLVSFGVAIVACVPFFLSFEKKASNTSKLMITAVMIVLSVVGRLVFYAVPFFKPTTAIVVIAAMYLGPETGFVCGAMSALISNTFMGQGPWTPFQMLIWGLIGLLAGLMPAILKKSKVVLSLYGVFSGVLYSLVMDVWTVLWYDGTWNGARYLASVVTALPTTVVYAVSNVIFLLVLAGPMGKKLDRVVAKY